MSKAKESEENGTRRALASSREVELEIRKLRLDGGTQPRAQLSDETVDEYRLAMEAGKVFPPVVAFFDGTEYWLAEGFHRTNAALAANRKTIRVEVYQGTRRDALKYSLGANSSHGLQRSASDKERAVRTALGDAEWGRLSNHKIGEICNVSHEYVALVRQKVTGSRRAPSVVAERGGRPYEMKTFGGKNGSSSSSAGSSENGGGDPVAAAALAASSSATKFPTSGASTPPPAGSVPQQLGTVLPPQSYSHLPYRPPVRRTMGELVNEVWANNGAMTINQLIKSGWDPALIQSALDGEYLENREETDNILWFVRDPNADAALTASEDSDDEPGEERAAQQERLFLATHTVITIDLLRYTEDSGDRPIVITVDSIPGGNGGLHKVCLNGLYRNLEVSGLLGDSLTKFVEQLRGEASDPSAKTIAGMN